MYVIHSQSTQAQYQPSEKNDCPNEKTENVDTPFVYLLHIIIITMLYNLPMGIAEYLSQLKQLRKKNIRN